MIDVMCLLKRLLVSACLMLCLPAASEDLSCAAVFADGMVLPRDREIMVWGEGTPGEVVTLQFAEQQTQAHVNQQGRWRAILKPIHASADNRVMRITSGDIAIEVKDVLVGEVWLLAGQSNMDFALESSIGGNDMIEAIADAKTIRIYDPPKTTPGGARAWPLETCKTLAPGNYFAPASWVKDDPVALRRISAVGGAFGLKLRKHLDVPIGLIDVSVGGSTIESWLPRASVLSDPELAPLERDFLDTVMVQDFVHSRPRSHLGHWLRDGSTGKTPEHPYRPGFLYEAGLRPIAPLPIAGILWYQGESNAEDVADHDTMFARAVDSWRALFRNESLPVYWVQLPELNREYWPEFRESQQRLSESLPHTGMAVAMGSGHPTDVHPRDKAPVGERLARIALNRTYGKDIEDSGPVLASFRRIGSSMQLQFDHVTGGLDLRLPGKGEPRRDRPTGFWIAGEDKIFVPAYFEEKQGNRLWLSHPEVSEPVAVRYAWEANVKPTLYNEEGLPAAPFRTDDWEPIRIACVGDSITHGTGTGNPDSESYPSQLSHMVGPHFDVRRFGVPGSSVVNGLIQPGTGWDRGYIRQRSFDRSVLFEPDIVIINLGINDVVNEDFNVESFVADYVALIHAYRRLPSKPRLVIWGKLAPLYPGQAYYQHPRLDMIQQSLDRVVEQAGVETIDMYTPLVQAGELFPDKIHPNAAGAKRIARQVCEKLRELGLPIAGDNP